jgi:hypothetical protein
MLVSEKKSIISDENHTKANEKHNNESRLNNYLFLQVLASEQSKDQP